MCKANKEPPMTSNGTSNGVSAKPPPLQIRPGSSLKWPTTLPTRRIQCAGQAYVSYQSNRLHPPTMEDPSGSSSVPELALEEDSPRSKIPVVDLFSLSDEQLKKQNHYTILSITMTSNSDRIKRAYHKACLKYHPDKTGRGEDDEVFLSVKTAFDVLSDVNKRKGYDSTIDFDESIPAGGPLSDRKFYKVYGAAFARNLRFAVRAQKAPAGGASGKKKKKKKGRKSVTPEEVSTDSSNYNPYDGGEITCPPFGANDATLPAVNAFYEYWTHFDSWRDFSYKAAELTEHDTETADCREEKRWMLKEIERKSRSLKKDEMGRINTLVERAMAADPRLKRFRNQERLEKEGKEKEKQLQLEAEEKVRKEKEEVEKKEEAIRAIAEKKEKESAKGKKEREKKLLRKAKQSLRKLTMEAFANPTVSALWNTSLETMNDDVELLCTSLSLEELNDLIEALRDRETLEAMKLVLTVTTETKEGNHTQKKKLAAQRLENRRKAALAEEEKKKATAMKPWSKEELTCLAKATKKYPAGGSNRWDAISNFISNSLQLPIPRSKEDCIAQYNILVATALAPMQKDLKTAPTATTTKPAAVIAPAANGAAPTAEGKAAVVETAPVWTEEQDKMLQDGLAKFPSKMDKNERWSNISKGVKGKGKKECVTRFKAIRDALKKKK